MNILRGSSSSSSDGNERHRMSRIKPVAGGVIYLSEKYADIEPSQPAIWHPQFCSALSRRDRCLRKIRQSNSILAFCHIQPSTAAANETKSHENSSLTECSELFWMAATVAECQSWSMSFNIIYTVMDVLRRCNIIQVYLLEVKKRKRNKITVANKTPRWELERQLYEKNLIYGLHASDGGFPPFLYYWRQ